MRRPTANMFSVMTRIATGGDPFGGCSGRSEYGGRHTVITALYRRQLVRTDRRTGDIVLTAKGIKTLAESIILERGGSL
jgi:hypothetical protein